jgi:hypothetical protein
MLLKTLAVSQRGDESSGQVLSEKNPRGYALVTPLGKHVISADIVATYLRISAVYLKFYDILVASGHIQGYPRLVDILGWNHRHQLMSISIGRVRDPDHEAGERAEG